jgi:hypothetical protein
MAARSAAILFLGFAFVLTRMATAINIKPKPFAGI